MTVLSASIVKLSGLFVPLRLPLQFRKTLPESAAAVSVTTVPAK